MNLRPPAPSPSPRASCRRAIGGFSLSPGLWVICGLAVASSLTVALWRVPRAEGLLMWTFARNHYTMYLPAVEGWNASHRPAFQVRLLSIDAMERRVLSAFTSGTPVAEVLEVQPPLAARAFSGPLEDVGFVDLTERFEREGLRERLNAPSVTPWTSRGRIFGLPHDVHPVMLAYRADLVEAAGISLEGVETWEDYFRVMRPLRGSGADGRPERFLLSVDETRHDLLLALMLQAGGKLFDARERPVLDGKVNARVIATVVSWCAGPDPVAVNVDDFTAGGNALKLNGYVVAHLMPDWLVGTTRRDLPGLAGKLKLMPLPAWEKNGRRTSVSGGSMLGLPRAGGPVGPRWEFAKHLYFSPGVARDLYRTSGIISPVKALWQDPVYDEPDPYFCGQAAGRLFIRLAPDVPNRTASPFQVFAQAKLSEVAGRLREWAEAHGQFTPEALIPEARRLLGEAEADVRRQMNRNVFLRKEGVAPPSR